MIDQNIRALLTPTAASVLANLLDVRDDDNSYAASLATVLTELMEATIDLARADVRAPRAEIAARVLKYLDLTDE